MLESLRRMWLNQAMAVQARKILYAEVTTKKKRPRDDARLAQLGLLGVGGMDDMTLADDDAGLEDELLQLLGETELPPARGSEGRQPRREASQQDGEKAGVAALHQLDRMVAECLHDGVDEDATSDDEHDMALMDELMGLSGDEDASSSTPALVLHPSGPVPTQRLPFTPAQRPAPATAGVSVLHLLQARLQNYENALAQATQDGETSRVRRFTRGLKTLEQMKKSLLAGKSINEEDIPPEVVIRSTGSPGPLPDGAAHYAYSAPPGVDQSVKDAPFSPAVSPTVSSASCPSSSSSPAKSPTSAAFPSRADSSAQLPTPDCPRRPSATSLPHSVAFGSAEQVLERLQGQYRAAAVAAKRGGDSVTAVAHLRVTKQLQPLLEAARRGEDVDLASLPPPPTLAGVPPVSAATSSAAPPLSVPASPPAALPLVVPTPLTASDVSDSPEGSPALPPVPTEEVLTALQQRRDKYAEQLDKAKATGDTRKERMNQRILKQYDDAVKRHKQGKPVAFDDLPTPPGFPPLPSATTPAAPPPSSPADPASASAATAALVPSGPAPAAAPAQPPSNGPSPPKQARPQPNVNVRSAPKSRVERQMSLLVQRQEQFKAAAVEAKKRGEIEQAKEYLRNCKGFNSIIEATAAGLPVDMNTVPVPPQEQAAGGPALGRQVSMDTAFEVINAEDCVVPAEGTAAAELALIYAKLEEDLKEQIKMCASTREHFKAVGDVASSNRFEQLIVHTKKDLDAVRLACTRGDRPPRCHYENRSFNIVQCNTDLNDSDCEVTVVRGINYNVANPTDVDTFVKIDFPFPTDMNPQGRTDVVKDSNSPEYGHKTIFSIDRKTRTLSRCFKRHSVRLTVHAKGGWFHRDTVVGIARVPLVELENKCTLHDSFDLSDERKKMVGGKLEVKVRVRNPILCKEIKQINEKWLVIDGF